MPGNDSIRDNLAAVLNELKAMEREKIPDSEGQQILTADAESSPTQQPPQGMIIPPPQEVSQPLDQGLSLATLQQNGILQAHVLKQVNQLIGFLDRWIYTHYYVYNSGTTSSIKYNDMSILEFVFGVCTQLLEGNSKYIKTDGEPPKRPYARCRRLGECQELPWYSP